MPTIKFYDAINQGIQPKLRPTITNRLNIVGIWDWEQLDKWHLTRFATQVKNDMSASSAHTAFAVFKAFLGKFEDELTLPKGWRSILNCKNELSMNTYLTAEEVEMFGNVWVDNDMERTVRDGFYVSCKTGLRHSDLVKLTPANFEGRGDGTYLLNYVSQKTKIKSTIPCSWDTVQKIAWLHNNGANITLAYYNELVKKLAERADINAQVCVFKAGEELVGPKYKFISSHSARRSFCTIMADLGVNILDIMQLAGHTSPSMTSRYLVRHEVNVNSEAEKFLMRRSSEV